MPLSTPRRARTPAWLLAALLSWALAATPAAGQSMSLVPERTSATIGDSIVFRVNVHFPMADGMPTAWVPQAEGVLPAGIRVVAADSVTKTGSGAFEGRVVLAFYRPGRQTVPSFALRYRRGAFVLNGLVRSEPVRIEIIPVLAPGTQPLKEIKGLEETPGPRVLPVVLALAALLAAAAWAVARRRRRVRVIVAPAPEPARAAPPKSPYEAAIERLAKVEGERWPARGEVARHYEAVADVLRRYLEEAERVPARERTTSALVRSLPPRLAGGGLRARCHELLAEADLVKFARLRPDEPRAADFLTAARDLLERWHRAAYPEPAVARAARMADVAREPAEEVDALR